VGAGSGRLPSVRRSGGHRGCRGGAVYYIPSPRSRPWTSYGVWERGRFDQSDLRQVQANTPTGVVSTRKPWPVPYWNGVGRRRAGGQQAGRSRWDSGRVSRGGRLRRATGRGTPETEDSDQQDTTANLRQPYRHGRVECPAPPYIRCRQSAQADRPGRARPDRFSGVLIRYETQAPPRAGERRTIDDGR
jgi:hypothetical protein